MSQINFQYRAIDEQGRAARGMVNAIDQTDAYRQIIAGGLRPVRITAAKTRALMQSGRKVSLRDLSHFTYQLSVLMQARVPIVDGLQSIAEQESSDRLRAVVSDIAVQIAAGRSVTEAMTPHRAVFGEMYIETVRAAESSGNMIEVLAHLATMLEKQYEMRKSMRGAMMYPICVVSALSAAVGVLLVFVVPRFANMFESRGMDLPLPTQVLIAFSGFLRSWWWVLIGCAVIGAFALRRAMRDASVRRRMDVAVHKVPIVREILRAAAVSRFSHVFGIALRSGQGLIEALDLAGRASARPMLVNDTEKMQQSVKSGQRLTDCLNRCEYVPGFAKRMLSAGENAGEVPRMCEIVARHYDREIQHLSKNIATLIEPIMIVGLSAVVLMIALAIFLPMWDMAKLMG